MSASRSTASSSTLDVRFYEHTEASYSSATVSTNATAGNLPGPGRTIGLAYALGGRALEAGLNALARSLRRNMRAESQSAALELYNAGPYRQKEGIASVTSLSTNATASNLPGVGRTLGLAYDFGGRILEARASAFAESKLGLGPYATADKLDRRHLFSSMSGPSRKHNYSREELKKSARDIRKLLGYATK